MRLSNLAIAVLLSSWLVGCASNHRLEPLTRPLDGVAAADVRTQPQDVRTDPEAYLMRVARRCRELKQYRLTLIRTERRGLGPFKSLHGPERIACWYRQHPFSIRMKWLDPDVKHGESTYVAGRQNDQVRFVPRRGFLGLEPQLTRVGLQTPVIWGEALHPVTDFGLQRLMERTLDSLARTAGDHKIDYRGLTRMTRSDRVVHLFRIDFPDWHSRTPIQELYIEARSDLPAGTRILSRSGRLEAAYLYEDLDTSVSLDDDDFLLSAERADRESPPAHDEHAGS